MTTARNNNLNIETSALYLAVGALFFVPKEVTMKLILEIRRMLKLRRQLRELDDGNLLDRILQGEQRARPDWLV